MDHVEQVIKLVKKAIGKVGKTYYYFPTYNGVDSENVITERIRERVFCYELYHQIKTTQEKNNENYKLEKWTLNGEPDKSGHNCIKNSPKPDFIFHTPGTDDNLAVIEVKGYEDNEKPDENGLRNDFDKLETFVQKYGYQCGIMLIYNSSIEKVISVIQNIIQTSGLKDKQDICNKIFVIYTKYGYVESKKLSEI
jgi:hypothetical protein